MKRQVSSLPLGMTGLEEKIESFSLAQSSPLTCSVTNTGADSVRSKYLKRRLPHTQDYQDDSVCCCNSQRNWEKICSHIY